MTARRADHKRLPFGAALAIYAAVLLALILAGLAVFSEFIRNFELSRPEYAVEKYISETLDERFFTEKMDERCPVDVGEFENPSVIVKNCCVKLLRGKELTYSKRVSQNGAVYVVMADGSPLCTLTLETGDELSFGFSSYMVSGCELIDDYFAFETLSVTIKAPVGATVYLNGIEVSDEYLTGSEPYGGQSKFQAASDKPLMLDVYTVSGLYSEPNAAVEADGVPESLSAVDGVYECAYPDGIYHSATVKAPASAVVKVNGIALGEEELLSTVETLPANGFDEKQSFSTYEADGLATDEKVSVTVGGVETAAVRFADHSYVADVPDSLKYTVNISVPDSADVYIGGKLVPHSYITAAKSEYSFLECAKAYVDRLPSCVVYTVSGLYGKPAVTVKHGQTTLTPFSETTDGRTASLEYTYPSDDALAGEYSETAFGFVRAYITYTSSGWQDIDANLESVLGYMLEDSELYRRIVESEPSIAYNSPYGSCVYNKLEARDFVSYSDLCFSCAVDFDVTLSRYSGSTAYSGTMRLVFVNSGGWRVCGMEVS